ncbi:MAG: hypothetical protein A2172_01005 [Candidatus Woykebacteria bacterium RBG_13_40_15]|uniref:DUF1648 domain-containing protein n=1 Tax=Candidatus Woykebacteria bacterium RBG_13_40_15 TaxID=1802593 RepID=A0A1G1W8V2_9BACT|nr:MAG: hypothetical protein A2172_01005 [Candidatus Woykebacteria bacterium RBG_13_40_15]
MKAALRNSVKSGSFISLVFSLLFLFLSVLLISQYYNKLPLAIPLWFTRHWGEARLTSPVFIWLLPIINISIIIINFLMISYFRSREKILSSILVWVSPIISGILFYTLFKIILVAT